MWIWDSYQAHLAVHPKPMATLEGAAGAPRCPPPPAAPCHSPSQWGPPSRPAFREQADDRSVPSQEGRSELMITQKADHKILQIHLSCEKREQRLGLSHRGQTAAQGFARVQWPETETWEAPSRVRSPAGPLQEETQGLPEALGAGEGWARRRRRRASNREAWKR
ncbi:uncharacterized protein LOC141559126 isoform X4 [Sminthopsis crassicaudata]|uniref:uncharacterized protein LOC141559126 isoform X4 n=1 Tax=Sminthopsis crassicaudata TaxID=9301 RepID=UPI003D68B700